MSLHLHLRPTQELGRACNNVAMYCPVSCHPVRQQHTAAGGGAMQAHVRVLAAPLIDFQHAL